MQQECREMKSGSNCHYNQEHFLRHPFASHRACLCTKGAAHEPCQQTPAKQNTASRAQKLVN